MMPTNELRRDEIPDAYDPDIIVVYQCEECDAYYYTLFCDGPGIKHCWRCSEKHPWRKIYDPRWDEPETESPGTQTTIPRYKPDTPRSHHYKSGS